MDAIERGISLFNDHHFWHAHEAWEEIWLGSENPHKQFLQGLIQLAAAYYHVERGTFSGGVRLFDASLQRLEGFPSGYAGVRRDEAVAKAVQHREKIARGERIEPGEFPKLRYNS